MEGLEVIPYREDRLVLATSLMHPLAQEKRVCFEKTIEYEYVGLLEASAIHTFLMQAAASLQRSMKIRIQVGSFDAVCRMIEANVGIGVLPESAARRYAGSRGIRIIHLTDEWAIRKLCICVRSLQMLPAFCHELIDILVAEEKKKPVRMCVAN